MDNLLRTCGKLVRRQWISLWTVRRHTDGKGLRPAPTQSTGCAGEKTGHILIRAFPQRNTQAAPACLWKRCAGRSTAREFSPDSERERENSAGGLDPPTGGTAGPSRPLEPAAPQVRVGYASPVCSIPGDAIDRIVAAIDQLASDAQDAKAGVSEVELTSRVAILWQMVSDLDPELARRAQRYAGPVDGGPSA